MWESDNAIFNVNGTGIEKLKKTLSLAAGDRTFFGYKFNEKLGLILYSYESGKEIIKFPAKISADQCAELVFNWLQSEESKKVPTTGWDADADHDGSNELGWRVYTEDWGHAAGDWNCVIVKPAYLWYGK